MEIIKRSVVARVLVGEGIRMNRCSTEDFYGSENTLYDTIKMGT